jgi:hypothetical protein
MRREKNIFKGTDSQIRSARLQRNDTFKLQIILDRHNARQNLNYCVLPHSPSFFVTIYL